jgi:hypothetical protein
LLTLPWPWFLPCFFQHSWEKRLSSQLYVILPTHLAQLEFGSSESNPWPVGHRAQRLGSWPNHHTTTFQSVLTCHHFNNTDGEARRVTEGNCLRLSGIDRVLEETVMHTFSRARTSQYWFSFFNVLFHTCRKGFILCACDDCRPS